ncbi:helix-turn-helix transcriptional regulator [Mucilaginibacter sp.]|jgi:transcriptional regulator with XRE-family HTH domain|uniref:helix-turn-helix domain-containing protein n=1 Tax=Mucilaginibacter sp. TaxID=1882438 RepID=UPI00261925CA|nr:helix-turn-helix transcriptional regulator [Mucilaginibacter sp.]MDB4926545.1 Helix-turn-helix protein [Mucilaginibacter sp.]
METITNILSLHIGRKVERVRKLRGLTQGQLGERLGGISKQAVSKIEQSEDIDDNRLKDIAEALDVTFDGLKSFNEERVLYNTINFYENSGVTATSISANVENINNPLEKTIELYERLLAIERQKFEESQKK